MASTTAGTPHGRRRDSVTGVDAWLLTLISDSTNHRIGQALAAEDLSVGQWRVLDYLGFAGPCTMSRLSTATSINGATLTRLVDHLVNRALVYRQSDDQDRRRVLVHLSQRGRRKARQLQPRVLEAEAAATAELTSAEREDLARLLRRMAPEHSTTIHRV